MRCLSTAVLTLLLLTVGLGTAQATLVPVVAGPSEVEVGARFTLTAQNSQGSVVNYTWDFRDGTAAFGPTVQHAFHRPGSYLVGVTLTGADGRQVLGTHTVQAVNTPPVAVLRATDEGFRISDDKEDRGGGEGPGILPVFLEVEEDQTVLLSGASSHDALPDLPHLTYAWDLGDGRTAEGPFVEAAYPHAGLYRVVLRVTDPHGAFATDEVRIQVRNVAPEAVLRPVGNAAGEVQAAEDEPLRFVAAASQDTPSDRPHLAYAWDLGDGSWASGPEVVHRYPRAGRYQLVLTVTDDNGARSKASRWVQVINRPPLVTPLPPLTVGQGEALPLTAEATDDPTDEAGLRYRWNGQEGGWETTLAWGEPGLHPLTLEVEDDDGAGAGTVAWVEVRNVAPHVALSDAHVRVDVEATLAGEPGNRVLLEVLRGNEVVDGLLLERGRGRPSAGTQQLTDLRVRLDAPWSLRGTYLAGNGGGDNPLFVTLRLENGDRIHLRHAFEGGEPATWTWTEPLNRHLRTAPIHLAATLFDPGPDNLTVLWDLDGRRTGAALPAGDAAFRDVEVAAVASFPWPRRGSAEARVTLEAVDQHGAVASDEVRLVWDGTTLRAVGLAPRVDALPSLEVDEGVPILLTAGATSGHRTALSWAFGDGAVAEGTAADHAYRRPGRYLARVLAEAGGETTVRGFLVEVRDVAVPAAFRIVGEAVQDGPLLFLALGPGAISGATTGARFHWDFGDGGQAVGPTAVHSYTRAGDFQVTLTVADPHGVVARAQESVAVANPRPHPGPVEGVRAEQDQRFRVASPLVDTPSDAPRLTYGWTPAVAGSGGPGLTLVRGQPGTVLLFAEAVDPAGNAGKVPIPVEVSNRAPDGHTPSLVHYGARRAVLLEALGTDVPSDRHALTYAWRFGDGLEGSGRAVFHLYPTTGTYEGELRVRDRWGAEDRVAFNVTVTYDADGDGLSAEMEASLGTRDDRADSDGDGLLDWVEALYPDSDGDGLWDGTNTTVAGVLLVGEASLGTDPSNPDTDGDGLGDGAEVRGWEVVVQGLGQTVRYRARGDPLSADGDEDGWGDAQERLAGTDPARWDTDGDGVWDDEDPAPSDDDGDGDGVSDGLDRVPDGMASLRFTTRFPPGLARFRQPFSVFSVEGLHAWVYKYNYVHNACQFASDETAGATRSSSVDAGTVLQEVERTFAEGGEIDYAPTRAARLHEQTASFLQFVYGGCDFWSPNQYRIGYAVREDKWGVDFANVREVTVPDGFGGLFQHAVETIPVRKGHPVSLVIQYSLPAEADRTAYADTGNFTVAAFGYAVHAGDPAATSALYANTAVAAGLEGTSYQVEIKIPGSVTSQAVDAGGSDALTLVLVPAWLQVLPFSLTKRALDPSGLTWASMSLRVPMYTYQMVARLGVNLTHLESSLPTGLEAWQTGRHTFGSYEVYIYNGSEGAAFDQAVLSEVDAVVLISVSEADLLSAREAVDWGRAGTWYEEHEDGFGNRLRWFKTVQASGSLSLLFLRFAELENLRLGGGIDLPEVPSEVAGRNVRLEVRAVSAGGAVRYNAYLIRPAAVKTPVGGLTEVREVAKVETLGSYESLDEVPHLGQRHVRMKAAIRGAGIGVVLVTIGRTAITAHLSGDFVKGSIYTAATATAIFGQSVEGVTLRRIGVRGTLARLKVGTVLAAATGAIIASHSLYRAASSDDSISQLTHLEQAASLAVDTGIVLVPGYGTVILGSWTVVVTALSVLLPSSIAARIVSTPGTAATFSFEYVFTSTVPSTLAEDAFFKSANQAISQMRQWNGVFQVPSIVILPPVDD